MAIRMNESQAIETRIGTLDFTHDCGLSDDEGL